MQADSDDAAWRAIVDNYGDRVELDPGVVTDPDPEPRADPRPASATDPADDELLHLEQEARARREFSAQQEQEERYIPPAPPPVPRASPDRLAAWLGLLGAPVALVLLLLLGVHHVSFIVFLLVVAFVAGFGYLVATMPRGPQDPYDDGARL